MFACMAHRAHVVKVWMDTELLTCCDAASTNERHGRPRGAAWAGDGVGKTGGGGIPRAGASGGLVVCRCAVRISLHKRSCRLRFIEATRLGLAAALAPGAVSMAKPSEPGARSSMPCSRQWSRSRRTRASVRVAERCHPRAPDNGHAEPAPQSESLKDVILEDLLPPGGTQVR